ncbi:MAG: ATP-binding protein [Defluviitaleaceae bacterium]|nr:ATP-binding protein [Defluviitaleaceae bacterium]
MYRTTIQDLYRWKQKADRKPLIIRGARQVGKTWLMKTFGAEAYKSTVYINFDNNNSIKQLFTGGFDIRRIIMGLELHAGFNITKNTLLIFDEVQETPEALTALKYFNEEAPEYHIICAGSLLGVALHGGTSFPVGKVEFLDMYPLSFIEFLQAMGREKFAELIMACDFAMLSAFREVLIDLLKQYYYIGGMPEVVSDFSQGRDFNRAREIQERILIAYEQDFSKHAPLEIVPRIRLLWNSIPAQLTKENKKFIYGVIKEGARAKEYELALMWLADCGLVHKIHRATAPRLPLKAYEDVKAFKLFMLDVGLLSCMVRLRQNILLDGNDLFREFKGALTEQFVLQQLATLKIPTYYWTNDRNSAEIDFLMDTGDTAVPMEVKAETNLQAKSLRVFRQKFNPKTAVRASMADYSVVEGLVNLPLYALNSISDL